MSDDGRPTIRRASGPRYPRAGGRGRSGADDLAGRRASESADPVYRRAAPGADGALQPSPPKKNAVHSVLTALPVMMLAAGLWLFYRSEGAQNDGAPIAAESVAIDARFTGLSAVSSGGSGRHYLWYETGGERHGVRVRPATVPVLSEALVAGDSIRIDAAPTVTGSGTRWIWRLRRGADVLLDDEARLR